MRRHDVIDAATERADEERYKALEQELPSLRSLYADERARLKEVLRRAGDRWGPTLSPEEAQQVAFERGWLGAADDQPPIREAAYRLFQDPEPHSRSDNNMFAVFENGTIHAFNGHRVHVAVNLRTVNYLKTSSFSGDEIRASCRAQIWLNQRPAYQVGGRDPVRCLRSAAEALERLFEHPVRLWDDRDREELIGRRIYYRDQPATVRAFDFGQLVIEADGEPFRPIPYLEGEETRSSVSEDFLSLSIFWFRDVEEEG